MEDLLEQHQNSLPCLGSEIMLQQTLQLKFVTPLYIAFIKKFPDLAALAQAEKRTYSKQLKVWVIITALTGSIKRQSFFVSNRVYLCGQLLMKSGKKFRG